MSRDSAVKLFIVFFLVFLFPLWLQGQEAENLEKKEEAIAIAEEKPGQENTVTVDFKDADIRNVLRVLSEKAGINIIAAPEVQGKVTTKMKDVPWEKALDIILKTYGFGYEKKENIIRVTTLEKLKQEKEGEIALQKAETEKEEIKVEVIKLDYIDAGMLQKIIKGGTYKEYASFGFEYKEVDYTLEDLKVLTPTLGAIQAEPKSNSLIINDRVSVIEKLKKIIKEIDRPTPQVLIESKIIETNLTHDEDLGIKWEITGDIGLTSGGQIPTTFPFDKTEGTRGKFAPTINPSSRGVTSSSTFPTPTATNPLATAGYEEFWPYLNSFSSNKFSLGTLSFTQLQILLEALASRSDTELLANPSVITLNNHLALIDITTEFPIPTWGFNEETGQMVVQGITKEKYGITLAAIPNVYEGMKIELALKPSVVDKSGETTIGGETIPILDVEQVQSRVLLNSGDTVVVGGLIKDKKVKTVSKVPILGDIPLLGLLFRHSDTAIVKKNLLIFITATVINPEELAAFSKKKELENNKNNKKK